MQSSSDSIPPGGLGVLASSYRGHEAAASPAKCLLIYVCGDAVSPLLCPGLGRSSRDEMLLCRMVWEEIPQTWRSSLGFLSGSPLGRAGWGSVIPPVLALLSQSQLCHFLLASSLSALSHLKRCGIGGTPLSSLRALSHSHSSDSLHCHSWKQAALHLFILRK